MYYQGNIQDIGKNRLAEVPTKIEKQQRHGDEKNMMEKGIKKADTLINKLLHDKKRRNENS